MRILFVAPSSYPIYQPEAMVNAKHIKLLTDAGFEVDLVCRDIRKGFGKYPPTKDDFFFSKVSSIHMVSVNTKMNLKTIIRHILTLIKTGHIYKAADWSLSAIKTCEKLLKYKKYDYIFTKDYPSELVGLYITKKYGLRWISTWNDPYMLKRYPIPYGKGIDYKIPFHRKKIIRDIGKHSFRNIFPSDRLRDYMLDYMCGMNKESCVIMPHILIENDTFNTQSNHDDNVLRLIHSGSLGKERDPETLFQGFKIFLNNNREAKVEITLLGIEPNSKSNYILNLINKYNLSSNIKFLPPVSYQESLELNNKYDICLLIEAPCNIGIFLPSKIIDYLYCKKPIFAISPQIGVMSDLKKRGIIDYISNVCDANNIAETFSNIYEDYKQNTLNVKKDLSLFKTKTIIDLHYNEILI